MAKRKHTVLDISCTSSDCDNNLHCFKATRKIKEKNLEGICRDCGAQLVDWSRVFRRDLGDVTYTFEMLKKELIRHHFWHKEIDMYAQNYAKRKGRKGIREAAENRIRKYVAPANPSYDGRQTPMERNPIFYGQHATASCCRKCVEYWHGIEQGRSMTDEEIQYLTELVCMYIYERLPELTDNGEKVLPFDLPTS